MWMKRLRISLLACALSSVAAVAQEPAAELTPEETITASIKQIVGDAQLSAVRPSVIEGLYIVQVLGGPSLMVTPDGKYAIMGDTYEVTPGGLATIQDPFLQNARKEFLANLTDKETINFAPEEGAKHVAYVFTDVDCGYCRRLHSQMHEYRERGELKPGYNDLGIEIRYLAYPRAGVNSPSAAKLESAWCADDQQAALNKLKSLQEVEPKTCEASPIASQYVKGGELGVNATPAILLPDGRFFLGYLPPERLLNTIQEGE